MITPSVFAVLLGCPPSCPEDTFCAGSCFSLQGITSTHTILDWNGDCLLDESDIAAFAIDVFNGEPCADLYCDGEVNADDLSDYITLFFTHRHDEADPC